MAENTEISWTDATFNPWMGCTKVGPGCDHCYAENLMDNRHGKVHWGAGNPRVRTGEKNWNLPLRWNKEPFYECPDCGLRGDARAMGDEPKRCNHFNAKPTRRRVFCSSLADVFDNEVDVAWRLDLFELIHATPNLDWLLLTKRIGNVMKMLAECLALAQSRGDRPMLVERLSAWIEGAPPANVWLGATIVNQAEADRDIPKLLAVPAHVRFLSMEPLLGPVDLTAIKHTASPGFFGDCLEWYHRPHDERYTKWPGIDWVIVGGESGHGARPMSPDWVRSLRDQCAAASVPFHFKQWGEWAPHDLGQRDTSREPTIPAMHRQMNQVGKKKAGRLLDGATHNAFPEVP